MIGRTSRATRFIPACAGNTLVLAVVLHALAVHPRMRGEHAILSQNKLSSSGSSPHARGTRRIVRLARNGGAVHPRMRGEHGAMPSHSRWTDGSSPHARGTL